MRWQKLGKILGLGIGLAMAGCASSANHLADHPELAQSIAASGSGEGTAGTTRAQKPDPVINQTSFTYAGIQPVSGSDPGAQPAARIWATVNGEAILAEEVRAAAQQALAYAHNLPDAERRQKIEEILKATLQQIVEREIVLQDAFGKLKARGAAKVIDRLQEAAGKEFDRTWLKGMKESTGVKSDEELKRFLKENGMSLDAARRHWERQFMAMEYMRSRIMPTVERSTSYVQLLEYFEKHPEEFTVPDSVEWQDLFIAAARHPDRASGRRFAESLAERIRKGEPFLKLSEQFDDGDSKLRGGDGIGRKRGEIKPPEAEELLFKMEEGEVGPVIEMANGYHVIRLVKRTRAGIVPFDLKAQKQIKDKIRNEVGGREMKRLVIELKREAVIEYAR